MSTSWSAFGMGNIACMIAFFFSLSNNRGYKYGATAHQPLNQPHNQPHQLHHHSSPLAYCPISIPSRPNSLAVAVLATSHIMSIALGDIIAVGKLAFTLYRQCYLVARGAPQDFQSLLADLTMLQSSIKLLEVEVSNKDSVLVRSGEDRLRMMQEMMKRVEATLLELEKFATKYAKLLDTSRSKTRKVWDRIKWSSELADIDGLRNKVRPMILCP